MKSIFFFTIFLLSRISLAQFIFSGIIQDGETKEKVQFAHISFLNSNIATSSNGEGYFELRAKNVADLDSIQITHISYESKKISFSSLDPDTINLIILQPNVITLQEVEVASNRPYELLIATVDKAKSSLKYPFSSRYYYREIVKDNGDYSKYSDAILVGNFTRTKEAQVGVEESRVIKLANESDAVLDVVSPIDVSKIVEFQYLNFLNRFLGDKRTYYDFEMKVDPANQTRVVYEISPRVSPEKNTLLFYGWVLTERDKIKHVKITSDSLCDWQKSMLGMTAKVQSFTITLNFDENDIGPILKHGVVSLNMDFHHKRFDQENQYLSEFIALNSNKTELIKIDRRKLLKSKTLYKHGSDYSTKFWEQDNIPIRTSKEAKLLQRLVEYEQTKDSELKR